MRDNKTRRKFYKSDDYTGKIPWRLKIGRENLPNAIAKVKAQPQNQDRQDWIKEANHWLKHRSSGFNNRTLLSKSEIKQRKKELGKILNHYNRHYSEGEDIKF